MGRGRRVGGVKKPLCDYRDTFYGSSFISPTPGVSYPIPPGPGAGGGVRGSAAKRPRPSLKEKQEQSARGGTPLQGPLRVEVPPPQEAPAAPAPPGPPGNSGPRSGGLAGGPAPLPFPPRPGILTLTRSLSPPRRRFFLLQRIPVGLRHENCKTPMLDF